LLMEVGFVDAELILKIQCNINYSDVTSMLYYYTTYEHCNKLPNTKIYNIPNLDTEKCNEIHLLGIAF
jgi:hypothetical protein